jgi:hypothetical protein
MNKEEKKIYNKNYNRLNKEIIAKKRAMNKEERKIYIKNYRRLNKEKIKIYNKNYNRLNREKYLFTVRRSDRKVASLWLSGHSLPYWKRKFKDKKYKNLTPEYMEDLTRTQGGCCYYTGIPLRPFRRVKKGGKKSLFTHFQQVSIDRLDPKKDYEKGNVVLASNFVNNMKGQCSLNQFKSLISLISKRHNIGKDFQDESFTIIRNKIKKTYIKRALKDKKRIQKIIGKKYMDIQKNYQEGLKLKKK